MIILTILSIFLFKVSNTEGVVNWNTEEIEKTVIPLVRTFDDSWKVHTYRSPRYHYKSHFGIIIKKGTTFTLTTQAVKNLTYFHFYCITEEYENLIDEDFEKTNNSKKVYTTTSDCVPMLPVSYNIDVKVKLRTTNWIDLPVLDTKNITYRMSEEAEREFYKRIEVYGFVESYYVQILMTASDVKAMLANKFSLYASVQNEEDIIKYYNYVTGASRYVNKNDSYGHIMVEKYRIFDQVYNKYTGLYHERSISFGKSIVNNFLNPVRGLRWALMHEIAHYYDLPYLVNGFANSWETWTNILSSFYKKKISDEPALYDYNKLEDNEIISNYRQGISINGNWNKQETKYDFRDKLQVFLTLFGYDGTDKSFREFNIRYYSKKNTAKYDVIPIILEVFFDLYKINILPFLKKVVDFKTYHLVSEFLELRLLTGRAVMPAIDFGLKPTDMKLRSRERDWRSHLPLMFMSKMKKKFVEVIFTIESPIDPTGACLYLNNICHTIVGNRMNIKLLSNVYSAYVLQEKNQTLYVSDIKYHKISKDKKIDIKLMDLPSIATKLFSDSHQSFTIQGLNCLIFKIFINYKEMTIQVKQISTYIDPYFNNKLYFSISLERNNSSIFKYNFLGYPRLNKTVVRVHNFQINDKIHIYHAKPDHRIKFDLGVYNGFIKNNTFLLTNAGLHNVADKEPKMISLLINKIDKINSKYMYDLKNNPYYQGLLRQYMNSLRSEGLERMIPKNWITPRN
ncbi:uncharacterized protein LOC122510112 [Leptopilina heterotoma]|uniref:uncharacterized protein LOC122510112 n=1 Tax=Leptopilina heterotoma TaxID=63436 RepID=UPI001CA99C51|nr:uncharacterized protein LOC122510112 [Leptopilina heterotoma]